MKVTVCPNLPFILHLIASPPPVLLLIMFIMVLPGGQQRIVPHCARHCTQNQEIDYAPDSLQSKIDNTDKG